MRQRNDTGSVQHVLAWPDEDHPDRSPFLVGPGEAVDYPTLIGGFTPLDPEPSPDPDGAEEKAPLARSRRSAAAAAPIPEGGEPQ